MLRVTVNRLVPAFNSDRILILTSEALAAATRAHLPEVPTANIITEPRPAGTAAALTWAALEVRARDGDSSVMACVHADWHVRSPDEFRTVLLRACAVATDFDSLVTVGVVPDRPEPGYGYIHPGEPVPGGSGAKHVLRFVEKPSRAEAARMCAEGYLWNSGIFAWRVGRFLTEVEAHTPEINMALRQPHERADFFTRAKPVSVDVGVLERSGRVLVVPGDFGWDDVGTWAALRRVLPHDRNGNAVRGKASLVSAANNVVHSTDSHTVLYGVDNLVVVTCEGITLVTTVDLAADLKSLLESLPPEVRNR
jgi:mannose-1-phosphate guanylyltransferase